MKHNKKKKTTSKKKRKNPPVVPGGYGGRYVTGGQVGSVLQGAGSIASMFPGIGTAVGAGLNVAGTIAGMFGPKERKPKVVNPADITRNSRMGFQHGGMVDTPISDNAVIVDPVHGDPNSIDQEHRNVNGTNVRVTPGEIIDGNHVYSDSKMMKHPLTRNSFAVTMEPIIKGEGKAQKTLDKYPNRQSTKNTLSAIGQLKQVNQARQDQVRAAMNKNDKRAARGFKYGGKVKGYNTGGFFTDPLPTALVSASRIGEGFQQTVPLAQVSNPRTINTNVDPSLGGRASIRPGEYSEAVPRGLGFTTGDIIGLAGTTANLIGQGIQAFRDPSLVSARQDNTRITRATFNPDRALARNQSRFLGQMRGINTGSINVDRALKSNALAQRMQADADIIQANQDRNTQAQTDFENRRSNRARFNIAQQDRAEQINAQEIGAMRTARSNFFNSLGNVATSFQNAFNQRAENRVNLAALNELSTRYGVSQQALMEHIRRGGSLESLIKSKNS